LLKPIYEYCKHRKNDTQPTPQTSFIECHIGRQLSRQCNLTFRKYLPHSYLWAQFCCKMCGGQLSAKPI